MELSDHFKLAVNDYLYLLEKHYPQKTILKIVGDKYKLPKTERGMLYRGISTSEACRFRISKLLAENEINGKTIGVDGFNVLLTIGSYLIGNTVFISNDNFLRDTSEFRGRIFRSEIFIRCVQLTIDYLKQKQISGLVFYFDEPVKYSQKACGHIREILLDSPLEGKAVITPSPDLVLSNYQNGIIATSDSAIINTTNTKVFDLARHILEYNFNPDFLNLARLEK